MDCSTPGFLVHHELSAAAAKSHQLCPTLCNPIDGSPLGSAVPGILQARTLEWVSFPYLMHESEKWKWNHSIVSDSVTPWTVASQAPPSRGFSRQEYRSALLLPSRSPTPGVAQTHIHWVGDAFQPSHPLSSPSPPPPQFFLIIRVFSNESAFASGGQSIWASASHQSFQWIFRTDFL